MLHDAAVCGAVMLGSAQGCAAGLAAALPSWLPAVPADQCADVPFACFKLLAFRFGDCCHLGKPTSTNAHGVMAAAVRLHYWGIAASLAGMGAVGAASLLSGDSGVAKVRTHTRSPPTHGCGGRASSL